MVTYTEIFRGLKPKEVAQIESYVAYVVQGCASQIPSVRISDDSTFCVYNLKQP